MKRSLSILLTVALLATAVAPAAVARTGLVEDRCCGCCGPSSHGMPMDGDNCEPVPVGCECRLDPLPETAAPAAALSRLPAPAPADANAVAHVSTVARTAADSKGHFSDLPGPAPPAPVPLYLRLRTLIC